MICYVQLIMVEARLVVISIAVRRMKGSMMVVTILTDTKKLGYVIVDFFLSQIKKLYKREKLYASKPDYYTPGRIKDARNDEFTNGIYNTFISTCVQQCRNFRDFFVDYVKAWNQGRRDFGRSTLGRLLPTGRKNLIKQAFAPCA